MSIPPTKLSKWKLLSEQDVSPSPHLPVARREYELPDGSIVDNFFVTTIPDSVHVIPVLADGRVVMIRMYKQGADDIIILYHIKL